MGSSQSSQSIGEAEKNISNLRNQLKETVLTDINSEDTYIQLYICQKILKIHAHPKSRYQLLDMENFMLFYSETEIGELAEKRTSLFVLEKYCRHLLLPEYRRAKAWREIKFKNRAFYTTVMKIEGWRIIMHQIGYSQDSPQGICFPDHKQPNNNNLMDFIVDFMLARAEINQMINEFKKNNLFNLGHVEGPANDWQIDANETMNSLHFTGESPPSNGDLLEQFVEDVKDVAVATSALTGLRYSEELDHFLNYTHVSDVDNGSAHTSSPQQPPETERLCDMCGLSKGIMVCQDCSGWRCGVCDERWHKLHSRSCHIRHNIHEDIPNFGAMAACKSRDISTINTQKSSEVSDMVNSPYSTNQTSSIYSTNQASNVYSTNQTDSYYATNITENLDSDDEDLSIYCKEPVDHEDIFKELKGLQKEYILKENDLQEIKSNTGSNPGFETQGFSLEGDKMIEEQLLEIELRINDIMCQKDEFLNDPDYLSLSKRKKELLCSKKQSNKPAVTSESFSNYSFASSPELEGLVTSAEFKKFLQDVKSKSNFNEVLDSSRISVSRVDEIPAVSQYELNKREATQLHGFGKVAATKSEKFVEEPQLMPTCEEAISAGHISGWHCRTCTYINAAPLNICDICGSPRHGSLRDGSQQHGSQQHGSQRHGSRHDSQQHGRQLGVKQNKEVLDINYVNPPLIAEALQLSADPLLSELCDNSQFSGLRSYDPINVSSILSQSTDIIDESAIRAARQRETLEQNGRNHIKQIRNAENLGFSGDDIEFASLHCGDLVISDWLSINFQHLINEVISKVPFEISISDAHDSLVLSDLDVDVAVMMCINRCQNAISEYAGDQVSENVIMDALETCKGDVTQLSQHLNKKSIQPLLDRMWDPSRKEFDEILNLEQYEVFLDDPSIHPERKNRILLVEGKLQSMSRVETLHEIANRTRNLSGLERPTLLDIVEAIRDHGNIEIVMKHLTVECSTCLTSFPNRQILKLQLCDCNICKECFETNFRTKINENFVHDWNCPNCIHPDMKVADERAENYLHFLTLMIQEAFTWDKKLLEIYETKLRDWYLQNDPNFHWCSQCRCGFLYEDLNPMTCSYCHMKTCIDCGVLWEDQHQGLTCKQFYQWKADNDPDSQDIKLKKHLNKFGISCPLCKKQYDLAKGGCIHFTCPSCKYHFCGGCNGEYKQKSECKKYKSCSKKGLHCHHPRNCLYYLRDQEVENLKKLLQINNINFQTECLVGETKPDLCPIMEQKDENHTLRDAKCGKEVIDDMAGLCQNHYKEYLVDIINQHKLDPIQLMDKDELIPILERCDIKVPKRKQNDSSESYNNILRQIIKNTLPLEQDK